MWYYSFSNNESLAFITCLCCRLRQNPCTWKQKRGSKIFKKFDIDFEQVSGKTSDYNKHKANDNFTNRKTSLICIQIAISYHKNLMTLLFLALPEYKIQIYKLQKDSKYGTFITFSMDPVMNRITFVKV